MKIAVVAGLGSSGDAFPLLGVAKELSRRAVTVHSYGSELFGARYAQAGLTPEFIMDRESHIAFLAALGAARESELDHLFFSGLERHTHRYAELAQRLDVGRYDAVITSHAATPIVHAYPKRCTHITLLLAPEQNRMGTGTAQPGSPEASFDQLVEQLATDKGIERSTSSHTVACFPRWFAEALDFEPDVDRYANFARLVLPPAVPVPDSLCRFVEHSPVIIAFASWQSAPQMVAEFIDHLRRADQRVLVFGGSDTGGLAALQRAGDEHIQFVPTRDFLPWAIGRARAVIHHAGLGMAAFSFAAGVPQLTLPTLEEQHATSRALVRLGVGLTYQPSFREAQIARLVNDAELRHRARDVQARLWQPDGIEAIADAVLQIIHEL